MLLGAVAFLDRQVVALLIDPMKAELRINDTQVSLLQGLAFAILYTGCAIPIGYVVDRYSRRTVIFAGVLIWAIAATLCGLAGSFALLLAARVCVGLGEAALGPASYSIIGDLFLVGGSHWRSECSQSAR
jgi:MFS family permease